MSMQITNRCADAGKKTHKPRLKPLFSKFEKNKNQVVSVTPGLGFFSNIGPTTQLMMMMELKSIPRWRSKNWPLTAADTLTGDTITPTYKSHKFKPSWPWFAKLDKGGILALVCLPDYDVVILFFPCENGTLIRFRSLNEDAWWASSWKCNHNEARHNLKVFNFS